MGFTTRIMKPAGQKIILMAFGLFLFLVIAELGLRAAGLILTAFQERRNIISISKKDTYRIMCIGESTTALGGAGSYPAQLEKILNEAKAEVKFSVINKGRPGVDSTYLAGRLEGNLNRYHPDIVVAMMGINDSGSPYRRNSYPSFKEFRIYKLAAFFYRNIRHIMNLPTPTEYYEIQDYPDNYEQNLQKAAKLNPADEEICFQLGELYLNKGRLDEAKDVFLKVIELDPDNDEAYVQLGRCYRRQGNEDRAMYIFKKTLQINPKNDDAYLGLGKVYRDLAMLEQAEQKYKQAIHINPLNDGAIVSLGRIYQSKKMFTRAEKMYNKAIKINPLNDKALVSLGLCYREMGNLPAAAEMFDKVIDLECKNYWGYFELIRFYERRNNPWGAEESLKKDLELNPHNDRACAGLGWFYMEQNNPLKAEEYFKKAIELNEHNDWANAGLAALFGAMGRHISARKYFDNAAKLRLLYYKPGVRQNYQKLKDILDEKNVKLVCVQYPMRSIGPFKKIFLKTDNIVFVDNEKIFKEALKTSAYKEYFTDRMGGDFGHCTRKGNRLLAENIAKVVIKEFFKDKPAANQAAFRSKKADS